MASAAPTGYREWERGPGVGRRVLGCLAVLVLTVVIVLAAAAVLSSSVVRPYIGRQIAQRLGVQPSATVGTSGAASQSAVDIPTPAPGATQLVISQDELNQRINEHKDRLGPLDSAQIGITPEGINLTMKAYGMSGQYHGQVVTDNGQVAITNGKIDGPLGWVVPVSPLESALNQQIESALTQTGVKVEAVTLQQGQMVLSIVPQS